MVIASTSILFVAAALLFVLALVWLAGRMARFGGLARRRPGGNGPLAVEDVLAIDVRRRLHLIRCERRRLLLLTGGSQDIVVGWVDPEDATR